MKYVGNIGSVVTLGFAYYDIVNGDATALTYVDAGVGSAGIASSLASYYMGIQVPYVGVIVALYGSVRIGFDLGQEYGPLTVYLKYKQGKL